VPPEENIEQVPTLESVIDSAIAEASPEGSPNREPAGDDDDGSTQTPDPAAAAGDEAQAAAAAAAAAAEAGAGGDADDKAGDGSGDAGKAKPGGESAAGKGGGEGKPGAKAAEVKPNGEDKSALEASEAAAAAAAKPKPPDVVNDPIPEEVKGKTRARMTSLIDSHKATTKELEESQGQVDTFLKAISETGADPDTFARHVEVLRLINSADPVEQRAAVKALRGVADRLAKDLGETEPGKELEGHPDLLEELEAGDITRARALEIANGRNEKKASDARAARAKETNDATAAETAAVTTARNELNVLEQELAKSDPLYYRKREAIEGAAKALIPTIHPTRWKAAYKRLYDSVDVATLPRAQPRVGDGGVRHVARGTGERQPQRPRQGAGGGPVKLPTSIEEAIDFGIEQARR